MDSIQQPSLAQSLRHFRDIAEHAEAAERLLKSLANRHRLAILCLLKDQELSVSQLNTYIPLSQSALSQHLAWLRQENCVETRRDSQTIYYRLVDGKVKSVIDTLYVLFCQE